MKVIRDDQSATWTFVPTESDEEQIVGSVAAILKPGDKLSYGGKEWDGDDDKFYVVHLHAGGHKEEHEVQHNVFRTVHVDSVELVLRGTTENDKYEVNDIRNTCYFGSGGLIFLGEIEVDGKKAIVLTAKYCKVCGGAIIGLVAWTSVCNTCAAKCKHQYKRTLVHGPETDIGMGEACILCGRGKPRAEGEQEKTQLERHLEVERELGIHVIYKNTPLTPSQIDRLQKVASAPNNQ